MAVINKFAENLPSEVQVPSLQPDFSQVQSIAMRANSIFEQNLNQVKNDYSSVLNAPVTGDGANERKQQYVNNFRTGLKKVATSDLSMPQNVLQAENLLQPFWSDTDLLTNMHNTKSQTDQINQYNSFLSSTDKDTRALADPDSLEDMQRGLKKLGDIPLNQGNSFQVRNFTPVHDMIGEADTEFNKLFGKEGMVKSTYSSGPTEETITNGPKSKDAYRAWVLDYINSQSKYSPQIEMKARLTMERSMDQIQAANLRQTGQKLSDTDLYNRFAGETRDELKNYYTSAISSVNKTIDHWDNEISKFHKGHPVITPGSPEAGELSALWENKNNWSDISDNYQDQYSKTLGYDLRTKDIDTSSTAYKATMRELSEHPESYLATISRGMTADGWANGMAGISQVSMKANEAYKNVQDHEDKMAELKEKTWHDEMQMTLGDRKLTDAEWKEAYKTGQFPTGNSEVRVDKNGVPLDNVNVASVHYETTDPQKLDIGLRNYQNEQNAHLNNINASTFGFNGLAGIMSNSVLGKEGLDDPTLIKWGEGMINARKGIPMTNDQVAASGKVKDLMTKYGIEYGDNRPGKVLANTFDIVQKVAHNLINSSDPTDATKAYQIVNSLTKIRLENDKYNTNEQEYKNNVADLLRSDPSGKYRPLIDPDTQLPWTTEGLTKLLPSNSIIAWDEKQYDGHGHYKIIEVSPEKVAKAWQEGNVTLGSGEATGSVEINGKTYRTASGNLRGLMYQFGNYDNYKSISDDAGNEVVKNMSEYKNGLISAAATYDLSGKESGNNPVQRQTGLDIAKDAILPDNNVGMYTTDDENKPIPLSSNKNEERELKLALENRNNSDWLSKNGASVDYIQHGPNGQGAIKLTLKPEGDVDPTGKDDKNSRDYQLRALRTVYIDISPHNSSKMLQSLPIEHNTYTYGSVMDGKPIESDPSIEEFGIRYHITPYGKDNISGKYTTASIVAENIKINPETGQFVLDKDGQPIWETTKQSFGMGNPDLLMDGVNKWALQYIADKGARVKAASQQPVPDGSIPIEEYEKQYLKKKSGEIGNTTNNVSNIKYTPEMGKLGAIPSGIKASDGGQFATFPTPQIGYNAYNKLLFGTTDGTFRSNYYKPNTTVDQAMKIWSNNGYGGSIYPKVANKKLSELTQEERKELIKRQLQKESPQAYNTLRKQGILT